MTNFNLMKWTIDINHNIKTGVSIIFTPEQEILSAFFHSLGLENVPDLINSIGNSKGYSQEFISLLFYDEMDWEDKEGLQIQSGDVCVYHQQFGETVIKEREFENFWSYMEITQVYQINGV